MSRYFGIAVGMFCASSLIFAFACSDPQQTQDNGQIIPDNGNIQYDANVGDTIVGTDVPRDLVGVDTAGMDIVEGYDIVLTNDTNPGDGGYTDLAAYDIYREDTTWYDLGPRDNGTHPDYGECANPGSCEPCGYGSLTGMTCAPNSTTGMPYVHVWIDTLDCDGKPVHIEDYADYAGFYRLDNVPCGTQTVYMEKGHFQGNYTRWIDKCVTNDVTSNDRCFPGQPARIAVITGKWDQIEKTLIALWFKHHQFDGLMEDGSTTETEGSKLLRGDDAKTNTGKGPYNLVDDYDILFLNCGNAPSIMMDTWGDEIRTTLKAFVAKGGSIYASDYASAFIYPTWPEAVSGLSFPWDFAGSATTTPRQVTGELVDEDLAAFMQSPTAIIEYRLGPLTSITGTVPSNVKVHVRGPNSSHGNAVEPFMISFSPEGVNGGRIVYTNFHNDEQLSTGDMGEVLQYVVFLM